MDLFAKHDAQWGMKAWSESKIGMSFLKRYSTMEVYFDVDGNHWYYTRYGRYFDKDKHLAGNMRDLHGDDFQHVWTVNTAVGVRSRKAKPSNTAFKSVIRLSFCPIWLWNIKSVRMQMWPGRAKNIRPEPISMYRMHFIQWRSVCIFPTLHTMPVMLCA